MSVLCSSAARAETITLPLQKFTPSSTMEIRCTQGTQSLSIPIPDRWNLLKANISLRYTVSNNLIGDISQMTVRMNGEPVAQTKLNPQNPATLLDITIPTAHLKPGYNTLDFVVVQHYLRGECELPCGPDLWTNISLMDSTLQLEYELKPLPLKLGEVTGLIFDPKQFPEAAVNIVAEKATPDSVTLATIVASGIARRFDYRKVKFGFSSQIKQGMDNVLIGSEKFAASQGFSNGQQSVSADTGLLKISHLPNGAGGVDDRHALLTITGEKSAAIKVVAETLASMTLPYPGTG
ncbi:MAG: cellulose biosynthesis cyclic di-GMP-binding regulatory protein BcsB, partial [Gallionella sp.]|nr:cellulose biosynthesis cyclic di-GMP-binding regulatory protein BcsB [Gallionella sp.]